jgi:hypothetical protein
MVALVGNVCCIDRLCVQCYRICFNRVDILAAPYNKRRIAFAGNTLVADTRKAASRLVVHSHLLSCSVQDYF